MSLRFIKREYLEIELGQIDPPELDARIDRDPDKLQELADDLARRGMVLPMAVYRDGSRFVIVDGYRRFLAAQLAQLGSAPCMVYPSPDAALEGAKYAANAYREDMSPAEEAVFFDQLFKIECGQDVDRVCAMVGKKRSYVEGRLLLLQGAEDVFEALRDRKISIGVAHELNKITDPVYRTYYLNHAVLGGASNVAVVGWVQQWKTMSDLPQQPQAAPAPESITVPGAAYDPHECVICGKSDPRFIPEHIRIHTHCKHAILEPLLANARGEA